jgi:3',5'-cyclic AMP phosphodiesterase CpdA
MKKILHISDIHFGRTDSDIIESLVFSCKTLKPDLVVISGDLTQRALKREFVMAQDFIIQLQEVGMQVFAVPGNHDIPPVYTPLPRVIKPFERYNTFIAPLVCNEYMDEKIALFGITTVRPSRFKGGRMSSKNILDAKRWFADAHGGQVRFVITHHPLDLPQKHPDHKLIQKAKIAVSALSELKIDVYLSGHYHRSSSVGILERYSDAAHGALAIQAGTVSNRKRGELQSFNFLEVERGYIKHNVFVWNSTSKKFTPESASAFCLEDSQWISTDE